LPAIISEEKISEIRERCSILTIVSGYLSLKKSGNNYFGLCPFHSEKSPSFTVNEDKGIFHCFGCGTGGNVFTFLMRIEGISFPEAVRKIAEIEGIEIPEGSRGHAKEEDSKREGLFAVHEKVVDHYHRLLMRSHQSADVRDYLKKRGLDSATAREWRLGYGGSGFSSFAEIIDSQKLREAAEKTGLINKGRREGYYDRFRKRLIFPICDINNRVIALGGRELFGNGPKYLNSPESLIYSKGNILYGLSKTKNAIRGKGQAIVVEGYIDLLSLYSAGIKNVVATLGTALTINQANLLKRYCKKLVLLFDSDEAGIRAAMRALEVSMNAGLQANVLTLPEGEDPDSFVQKFGGSMLLSNIEEKAMPSMDYIVEKKLQTRKLSSPQDVASLVYEMVPFIKLITDSLERSLTVRRLSGQINVEETLIWDALGKGKNSRTVGKTEQEQTSKKKSACEVAQETIIELMMRYENILDRSIDTGIIGLFVDNELKKIGEKIVEIYTDKGSISPSALIDSLDNNELQKKVSEMLLKEETAQGDSPLEIFVDCKNILKEQLLIEEENAISNKLISAQQRKDYDEINALLQKKQEVLQKRKKAVL